MCIWLVLATLGCAELGERELEVCGNGIVEPDVEEACDGQERCIAAGEVGQCQWSCAESPGDCPDGSGCGLDGICRAPSFAFESEMFAGDRPVPYVEARDLDGDGRAELVWVEAEGEITPDNESATLHVTRFDGLRQPIAWTLEREAGVPTFSDIDRDGLTDMVVGLREPVVVPLRNRGDGTFEPMHVVADTQIRDDFLGVVTGRGEVFLRYRNQLWRTGVGEDEPIFNRANIPSLAWNDAVAVHPKIDDPGESCNEFPGTDFAFVDGAALDAGTYEGPITLNGRCTAGRRIRILPDDDGREPAYLPWVAFVDVDGKHEVDLLTAAVIGNEMCIYVSYGGARGFSSDPSVFDVPDDTDPEEIETDSRFTGADFLPLEGCFEFNEQDVVTLGRTVGMQIVDLDQDSIPDIVSPDFVATSRSGEGRLFDGTVLEGGQEFDEGIPLAPAVGDIDRDGALDVVSPFRDGARGELRLLQSNVDNFSLETIPLSAPPTGVVVNDFDGDGSDDIVVQVGAGPWPSRLELLLGTRPDDGTATVISGAQQLGMAAIGGELLVPMLLSEPDDPQAIVAMATLRDVAGQSLASAVRIDDGSWEQLWALGVRPDDPVDLRLVSAGVRGSVGPDGRSSILVTELRRRGQFLEQLRSETLSTRTFNEEAAWSRHANAIAVDLDEDGQDELVAFAAQAPGTPSLGDTLVRVLRFDDNGLPVMKPEEELDPEPLYVGPPPSVAAPGDPLGRPNRLYALEPDGQDGPALLTVAASDEGRGARRPTVAYFDGLAFDRLEPLLDDLPSVHGWTPLPTPDRVFTLDDGRASSGVVMLEAADIEPVWSTDLALHVFWTAVGDLDGDSLPDVALGTDRGLTVLWGLPAFGEEG